MPNAARPLLLALSPLLACSHPLDEGAYDVTLTDVPVNECQVDEASLGAGTTLPVTVSWAGESLLLTGFGPAVEWLWDGADGFSTSWEETDPVAEDCDRISTFDMAGTIVSSASFAVDGLIGMRIEGACTTVDPSFTACSVQTVYEGEATTK